MPLSGPGPRDTDAAKLLAVVDPATMRPVMVRAHNVAGELGDLVAAPSGIGNKGPKVYGQTGLTPGFATERRPANPRRIYLRFRNGGDATVYLGNDNTVRDTNGFPVPPGRTFDDYTSNDAWWTWVATGGPGGSIWWIEVSAP